MQKQPLTDAFLNSLENICFRASFNKVAGTKVCDFIKNRFQLQHRYFFYRTPPMAATGHGVIQQNDDLKEYLFF